MSFFPWSRAPGHDWILRGPLTKKVDLMYLVWFDTPALGLARGVSPSVESRTHSRKPNASLRTSPKHALRSLPPVLATDIRHNQHQGPAARTRTRTSCKHRKRLPRGFFPKSWQPRSSRDVLARSNAGQAASYGCLSSRRAMWQSVLARDKRARKGPVGATVSAARRAWHTELTHAAGSERTTSPGRVRASAAGGAGRGRTHAVLGVDSRGRGGLCAAAGSRGRGRRVLLLRHARGRREKGHAEGGLDACEDEPVALKGVGP